MTSEELATIGERIYGPHWVTPLARALGVGQRIMRRWAGGVYTIPASIADDVRSLLAIATGGGRTSTETSHETETGE